VNFDGLLRTIEYMKKNVNMSKPVKKHKKTPEKGVTPGKGEIGGT